MIDEVRKRKEKARRHFLGLRKQLGSLRRKEAATRLFSSLTEALLPLSCILSYSSFGSEIDMWPLNRYLAVRGKLALPYTEPSGMLCPYRVIDIESDLCKKPSWKILEPDPTRCEQLAATKIQCALIPGLAFDLSKERLGWGKGCYDQFLVTLGCPLWGVGFQEQLSSRPLPIDSHDIPLTALHLF